MLLSVFINFIFSSNWQPNSTGTHCTPPAQQTDTVSEKLVKRFAAKEELMMTKDGAQGRVIIVLTFIRCIQICVHLDDNVALCPSDVRNCLQTHHHHYNKVIRQCNTEWVVSKWWPTMNTSTLKALHTLMGILIMLVNRPLLGYMLGRIVMKIWLYHCTWYSTKNMLQLCSPTITGHNKKNKKVSMSIKQSVLAFTI